MWRRAINQMKLVLKSKGLILITTRSKGFGYHEYPGDYWRYELKDMVKIFDDFFIWKLEKDALNEPGIFIKAQKPEIYTEPISLMDIELYRIPKP